MKEKIHLTTKKKLAVAIAVVILILIAVGTGTVLAVGSYNQSTSIGEGNAQNFAFLDAGVDPAEAVIQRTEFDYEQGQFVYEVEFTHDGTEYEYWVKASDGSIVKKETELNPIPPASEVPMVEITLEKAKEIALADAGLKADGVTFTESETENDDGNDYFELEFQTDDTKFKYEIDRTGHIYSKSKEIRRVSSESEPADSAPTAQVKQEETKPADTETKKEDAPKPAESEPKKETSSEDHKTESKKETSPKSPKSESKKEEGKTTTSNLIGLDKAKAIAADRAGLSVGSVTFIKAKLDSDDGQKVYELDFYRGNMEYECEVDAKTGKIIDYEADCEVCDDNCNGAH